MVISKQILVQTKNICFLLAVTGMQIVLQSHMLNSADHPSNNKKGGVCIYYLESLAAQLVKINCLNECLLCVSFNNKKGYNAVLYRSPSQN